jgi:Fe-S-cluster-containing dehydrogenase component
MHPADAGARGLGDGDVAAVWNDRGRIELRVRLDEGLRPGVVHVLEGRCHEGDPDINVLTDAGVTDMNYGATFYECLVQVAPSSGPSPNPRPNPSPGASPSPSAGPGLNAGSGPSANPSPSAGPGPNAGSSPSSSPSDRGQRRTDSPTDLDPPTDPDPPSASTGFLLDLHRCVGCSACVLACRLENGWSAEAPWRRVLPLNLRRRPGGPTYFLSVACHHCERPACLAACPSGAYEKRADGIVVHHEEKCIGCRYCEMACRFGAPRYSQERKVMTKCHLCHHRLDAGESPACVAACPTEALRTTAPASSDVEGQLPAAGTTSDVPGFADVAGCSPNIRFIEPRGRRRAERYRQLRDTVSAAIRTK